MIDSHRDSIRSALLCGRVEHNTYAMSAFTPVNPNWSFSNTKSKDPKQSSTRANDSLDCSTRAALWFSDYEGDHKPIC